MTDPEDTLDLLPSDFEEVEVDAADESSRPGPFEAEPADVAEQKQAVEGDEDDYREAGYEF
jgi:hypothetical protein